MPRVARSTVKRIRQSLRNSPVLNPMTGLTYDATEVEQNSARTANEFTSIGRRESAGAGGIRRNIGADDRTEFERYTRNDFLGPLIAARPEILEEASFVARKRTPDRTPRRIPEKRPEFAKEIWWRRGELNPRPKTFRPRPLHAYSAI